MAVCCEMIRHRSPASCSRARNAASRCCSVVVSNPGSDDLPSLIKIEEQALVERLVTRPAIERFQRSHFAWACRVRCSTGCRSHLVFFGRAQDCIRGELGAAVGHDHRKFATLVDERGELAGNPSTRDRGVRDRDQILARHMIDDVGNAQAKLLATTWIFGRVRPRCSVIARQLARWVDHRDPDTIAVEQSPIKISGRR